MGFDNECILDMQSLPGEYFCPVCRTLVYPNEALQSQCTHLYCKPCLAYVVATTRACPYDGYLVTEADSKPLMESNKAIAETMGKVAVYCLYHRSGCQWQGTLNECLTHCTGCSFGDSAVLCNRCGAQIVHRQVQEHAQICPGLQPQAQQLDTGLTQGSTAPTHVVGQETSVAASAASAIAATTATMAVENTVAAATASTPAAGAPASTHATAPTTSAAAVVAAPVASAASAPVGTPAASAQTQAQVNASAYAQPVAQVTTPEQWYQQQQLYQQYYQQYPGYDQYQQQYQQYAQYQQQVYPQYSQSQMQVMQQQSSPYMQPQPYVQPYPHPQTQLQHHQLQPQPNPKQQAQPQVQQNLQAPAVQVQAPPQHLPPTQPQLHLQLQSLPQPQPTTQALQMQAAQAHPPVQQPCPQPHLQALPLSSAQVTGQQFVQPLPRPHRPQTHIHPQAPAQQLQAAPHQQPIQPQQLSQPQMQNQQPLPQQLPPSQTQPQAYSTPTPQHQLQQLHTQLQPHPQSQTQPQLQPTTQSHLQHPSARAVTGHQSFPQPQMIQQAQPGVPPQRPMPLHPPQQGMPHHPVPIQSQLPPQQPPQLHPPHGEMPLLVQQQPMVPPHGTHSLHPPQQHQHHFAHHIQQLHHHTGLQPQAPQQSLPPQQAQGHFLPGQPHLQGVLPPQQQLHSQGSMPMQQHVHPHHYLQQNVAQAQALPTHQAQAVASRPMMVNHGMPQQAFQQSAGIPHKLVQPSGNQQNQNHLSSSATGSQGSLGITLTAPYSGVEDRGGHAPKLETELLLKDAERKEKGNLENAKNEEFPSAELKNKKLKLENNEDNVAVDIKEMGADLDSAQIDEKDLKSLAVHENAEGLYSKQDGKQEVSDLSDDKSEPSLIPKNVLGDGEIHNVKGEPIKESGEQGEGESSHEHIAGKIQVLQQMPVSGVDSGQVRHQIHQDHASSYERALIQPEYHEKNPSQVTRQGPASNVPSGMPFLLSGEERYPLQQIPPGHPSNFLGASQRFPPPGRMFPRQMPHPGPVQDGQFHEPSPYQMQAHGHSMGSGQMRPSLHGLPEPRPNQGPPSVVSEQPHMQRPNLPYGSYHSEGPHAVFSPPGLPNPSAKALGNVGLPHKTITESMARQDLNQSHMPLQHTHGEALTRPPIGGLPSGTFDTSPALMPRGPFGSHDHLGPSHTSNSLDAETYGMSRHGRSFGKHSDPHLAQSSMMSTNGFSGKSQLGGMHDPVFTHGLAVDRFKPLPEERFRHLTEAGLPGRPTGGRREFEENLKQFPGPAHLDGEGVYDSYFSSSRPGARGMQQFGESLPRTFDRGFFGSDGVPPFPSRTADAFAASSAISECHIMDISKRNRLVGLNDEFGINNDQIRPMPEFGHHRMDSLTSLRSPGHFGLGGKLQFDDFDGRELHGFMERSKLPHRSSDSAGSHQMMEKVDSVNRPGKIRKELDACDAPHIHFRPGEPLGHGFASKLRGSETFGARNATSLFPGGPNLAHSHIFPSFANEPGHFGSASVGGDLDPLDHSRKRKRGGIWCLICKIDCETQEGLEVHSQTKQHLKMTMDVVMSIKLENPKAQRILGDNVSLEESNKSRKMIFGKRGNRQ